MYHPKDVATSPQDNDTRVPGTCDLQKGRTYQAPQFDALPLAIMVRSGGSGVPDKRPTKFP